jgi:hypothetical protein
MAERIRLGTVAPPRPVQPSTVTDEQRASMSRALLAEQERKLSREELHTTAVAQDDTELLLRELHDIAESKRKWTAGEGKKHYERLREAAAKALEDGNRYFLDAHRNKWFAVRVQSKPVVVSLPALIHLFADQPDLLDAVAPRKVDMEAFRKAVSTERISTDELVQVAHIGQGNPFVRFYPDEEDEQ